MCSVYKRQLPSTQPAIKPTSQLATKFYCVLNGPQNISSKSKNGRLTWTLVIEHILLHQAPTLCKRMERLRAHRAFIGCKRRFCHVSWTRARLEMIDQSFDPLIFNNSPANLWKTLVFTVDP